MVGREVYKLRDIQRYCKTKIIPQAIPSLDDITEIKAEKILDQAKEVLADMDLNRISHIIEKKLLGGGLYFPGTGSSAASHEHG